MKGVGRPVGEEQVRYLKVANFRENCQIMISYTNKGLDIIQPIWLCAEISLKDFR